MGTNYFILHRGHESLELDEHGMEFTLIGRKGEGTPGEVVGIPIRDLTRDEVIEMSLKSLQVASYWMSEADLEEAIREWRVDGGKYSDRAELLEMIGRAAS